MRGYAKGVLGTWPMLVVTAVVAYLSGSIPIGPLLARRRGVDLRRVGSGNIGATNAARALGWRMGLAVLLLDALKGAGPVLVAGWLVAPGAPSEWIVTVAGVTAVLGHCFPVWLRFRGGKGVATALGVFIVVAPLATAGAAAVVAFAYVLLRVVSVGSLVAAALMPLLMWWRGHSPALVVMAGVIGLMVLLRHHDNLRRLLAGREHQL